MNGCRWFLLAVFLCIGHAAHSIDAVVSYTVFHKYSPAGKDSAFIDVYWQVNPSSLHYKKNDKGELVTQIQTAVSIANEEEVMMRDRYALNTTPFLPGKGTKPAIFEMKRYYVPEGEFHLQVSLGEAEFTNATFEYKEIVNTTAQPLPFLSRFQLLDTFFASQADNIFVRNGFLQLPRVLNFYDEGQRRVHVYAELYADPKNNKPLINQYYISRKQDDYAISRFLEIDTIPDPGNKPYRIRHTFDISTLQSGNYYINNKLKDFNGNLLDTQSCFLQIINKKPENIVVTKEDSTKAAKQENTFLDLGNTFVSKFNLKQLMAILKMITPVADPTEARAILNFQRKPDEMYMRYFIYNFFAKNDKAHPENEWKLFSNKVREVNREFNGGGRMGYETDRGIIYLKYGKPDELVRVPNETGAVPYEVWRYNAVGNTNQVGLFLFYQPASAIGDYKYLTSTVPGELQNPSWKNMLYINGSSSSAGNSRAQQYMEGK